MGGWLAQSFTLMNLATLFLAGRGWLWPAVGALVAAFVFVAWSYLRAPARTPLRLACAVLKMLGLAALLACLLEPTLSGQRAKPGANVIAVVADNSLSMTLHDAGASESRSEERRVGKECVFLCRSRWSPYH